MVRDDTYYVEILRHELFKLIYENNYTYIKIIYIYTYYMVKILFLCVFKIISLLSCNKFIISL